jgi:parallel beta-helix repeat protein
MKRELILTLVMLLICIICASSVSGATHYVNPSNYLGVIANSNDGDTIIFRDGTYHVNDPIYILNSLKLIAENPGKAILKAYDTVDTMLDILVPKVTISNLVLDGNNKAKDGIHGGWGGDNTNNGHFTGNTIKNCNNYGIFLNNSAKSVFSNNKITGGRLGIAVLDSPLAVLTGNTVKNADCTGITVGESKAATVSGNTVSGSGQDGILISQSTYSELENNNVLNNAWGGISLDRSSNSLLTDNTATGNKVGIALHSTDSSYIMLSDLLQNDYGLTIDSEGNNNYVIGNNINNNGIGVRIYANNNISYNNITNNTGAGIRLETSKNHIKTSLITNNNVLWNMNGIQIVGDQNNIKPELLEDNLVLGNNYSLRVQGDRNTMNKLSVFGNVNGLYVIGDNNVLINITAAYNDLTGIIIRGVGNDLGDSLILNNTNGIKIIGNATDIYNSLILNNTNGITVTGDTNKINGILILNSTKGLTITGGKNTVNGTEVANSTRGIIISGNLNNILNSFLLNYTNGISITGNKSNIYGTLFLDGTNALNIIGNSNTVNGDGVTNNTNGITVTGNQNSINGNEVVNGTNGITVTGITNSITDNSVNNNKNTGIYISGNNIVTGNTLTQNNGSGLVIKTDNNNVNMSNIAWNMIFNNDDGITLLGNGNNINNILTLFNIILSNNYALNLTGSNNQLTGATLTLNQNGLQVNGNNNTLNNITASYNNQTGVTVNGNGNSVNNGSMQNNTNGAVINGSKNTVNGSKISNNTEGLTVNGSQNKVDSAQISNNTDGLVINGSNNTVTNSKMDNNTNGVVINGSSNTLNQSNIHNSSQNAVAVNGDNNTIGHNNISENQNGVLIEKGTNNTLNYNRIARNNHNLHNNDNGTVNARYNWWGSNTPSGITGQNIDYAPYVVAQLSIENSTIQINKPYTVLLKLVDSDGNALSEDISPFEAYFNFNGEIDPTNALIINNQAETQITASQYGVYQFTAEVDDETLVMDLETDYPPVVTGTITPSVVKTGDTVTIKASSDPDTATITASIMGNVYNLLKDSDGSWILQYIVPSAADGSYDIILTATDFGGNQGNCTLNFTVDNTPPVVAAMVVPDSARSGNTVTIEAAADPDTENVTATILGTVYNLIKGADGTWTLQYVVPQLSDGFYEVLLTATDEAGNQGTNSTGFTVDNTMPSINATTIPNLVRTGDVVTITATADSDTVALTAKILGIIYDMVKGADGTWILQYTVPQVSDGFKNILLTATDHLGNQGTASTGFTVDNTPPTMHAVVNPDLVKSGNVITLKVAADLDTKDMTANIRGVNYNLVKGSDGKWTMQYTVPVVSDGSYGILLTATDMVGNKGTCTVNFVVDNTPPTIHASVTPSVTRSGGTITLKVTADSDTKSLTASIRGKTYNLVKGTDGIWILHYTVPNVSSGDYDIYLTATDQLGNQGNATVSFTVDNTPPASSTSPNNNCGAVALANLLGSLGIGADAGTIASLAGTDESGTSFYGLIEAAKIFGVNLNGVSLDSDQLQSGDIVLLNIDGISHYSTVLLRTGDLIVLQDPFLGTVILSMDQFNEIYTGYALTLRDVGTSLGLNELQSLFGGTLNSNSDYQEWKDWWDSLPQKNKEEMLNHEGEVNVFKSDDLTSSIFDKVNRYTFETGNNVFGIPGSFEQLVFDPNNPLGLTSEEKNWATEHMIRMDNRTPEQKKADEDLLRLIDIIGLLIAVGVITWGAGDIAILGGGGLETEAAATGAETAGETSLLDGISEWGSSNLNPIKDFLVENLPRIGIRTNNYVSAILDSLSWVTFPFGPNPVSFTMLVLQILIVTRSPWLARNIPYNSFAASMTLGDLFALILGMEGPSEGIWDSIMTGIGKIGELWNNLTNSQNNSSGGYNGLWLINVPGIASGIVNGANEFGKWIGDSASKLGGWISDKTIEFSKSISDLGKSISDDVSKLGSWISNGISNATNVINNFVNNAVANAADQVARGAAQAVKTAQAAYKAVAQVGQAAAQAAYHASQAAYKAAVQASQTAYKAVVNTGQTIYKAAVHTGQTIYKAAVNFGQTAYKAIVNTGHAIYKAAVNTGHAVYKAVTSAWNWLTGR